MSTNVKKDRRRGRRPPRDTTKADVSRFAGDAYSLAERAVRGVRYISKLINIETKFVDFISNISVSSTPATIYVSSIAQGTDLSNRVGDSIRIQSLQYSLAITGNTASTGTTWVRLVLVRDLQNQGTTPVFTDVFTNASDVAFPIYVSRTRYNVLFDEVVMLNREVGPLTDIRRGSIPQNGHIRYRGTGSTSASAAEGSLFLLVVSSAATNTPSLDYAVRLTYTDD